MREVAASRPTVTIFSSCWSCWYGVMVRTVFLLGRAWASPIKRVVGQVHWRPSWTAVVVRSIIDLLWSPRWFAACHCMAGCAHPLPACYFTSFTGLRMHASLSRPTRMGSFHGQARAGLDARAGQASMTIVQGTTPDRVHAEMFARGSGHA